MARRSGRLTVALVTLALGATLGAYARPAATQAATSPFTDIAGTTFEADIEWLFAEGITVGCTATAYCPDASVTRDEMASFLVRMFDLTEGGDIDVFTDDESSTHETEINRLAYAGITKGCSPTTFCPGDPVLRGEMASFLSRAIPLTAGVGNDYFRDDDENIHEANIDRAAAAGVASGCGLWRFCPSGWVSRGQMAGFLHRVVMPVSPPPHPAPGPQTLFAALTGTDDGNTDGKGCRVKADPCRTIRHAVSLAFDGDQISIGSGIFREEKIILDADLTIMGDPYGRTTIDASGGGHYQIFNIWRGRIVKLHHLTLTGGRARFGGAIQAEYSDVTISDSTIVGNGVTASGGGLYSRNGSLTITNSTITGNSAVAEGGGILFIGRSPGSGVTITNSTISGNRAHTGGGISSIPGTTYEPFVILKNALIIGNASAVGGEIDGTLTNPVASIVGIPAGLTLADILDPAGLADNGGPTKTIALTGSALNPARHHGHAATCAAMPVNGLDQRGLPRTLPCDIGAYELQP